MWETLSNNADWDCFKTPILLEILRIQNLRQLERYAFWEVIHLFQSVWCVRNKLQFRTVHQNQKSFLWMQDWGWMISPHLICGIWSSQFLETRIKFMKNGETNKREVRSTPHTIQKRNQSQGVINDLHNVDFIPSNVNSSHQEDLLYVFEDNEAVIKTTFKGRSPTMRHVSRTHRVALDWSSDRIIWTPKSKSKTLTPKTNSQTYWPSEIWHVMNGIIFCVCSTLPISVLPIVLKWCRKERNKDSGEERVTAKPKTMMNLVLRCSERTPDVLVSTASESPGKTRHENQQVLSSWNEHHQRTGRPVEDACSSSRRQLGCVFQDMEPPKSLSILRKSSYTRKPIRCVKFTKAVVRHVDIRDQNPSLGMIGPNDLRQRNPKAPKFEDRSHEETEWQERCARDAAWRLTKSILKLNQKNQTAFFTLSENWCLPAPSTLEPEERKFVVDSGASMHMISKKGLELCWNGYFDEVV